MTKDKISENNPIINNDCTNNTCSYSCNNTTINCACKECIPGVFLVDPSSQTSTIPILSNTIVDCINIQNTQYMRSSPVNFTIDTTDTIYVDNSPICINSITYSYDCLGLPLPETFYFCGNAENFKVESSYCSCTFLVSSLSDEIQNEINTTVNAANSTIGLSESVLSSTTIASKTAAAISDDQSLGKTIIDASITVASILAAAFQPPITNDIVQALLDLSNASQFLAEAANDTSTLLDGLNTTTIQTIANNVILSAQQIINGATLVRDYPNASAQTVDSASNAINTANNLMTQANSVLASPNTQSFTTANNLIFFGYLAAAYLNQGLSSLIQTTGNSGLQQYLASLGEVIYSIYLLQFSQDSVNSASSYPSQQVELLNSSANAALDGARYAKLAVNYTNIVSQSQTPLYRDFFATLNSNICNRVTCCCQPKTDTLDQLFFHPIYSLSICDLKISVCGTIGMQPFTAHANYDGITPLVDLGYDTIKLDSLICTPVNSTFTLREHFDLYFGVQCILPTKYFILDNPLSFNASLYSYINVNTNLSSTMKNPLTAVSRNVTWLC